MNKTISTALGILIIVFVAGVAGASVLFFNQEDEKVSEFIFDEVQEKDFSNIIQEAIESVIIEEEGEYKIYKGITLGNFIDINDSKISFSLDSKYDFAAFYNIKSEISNVFLEEGGDIKKLSSFQINELKKEKVLSVKIRVKKENIFLENIENFYASSVFAKDWYIVEEIESPEKIIFKKAKKQKVTVTGEMGQGRTLVYWTFKPDKNQGLYVEKNTGEGREEYFTAKVTEPLTHLIKFKNGPEYFNFPIDNFHQNSPSDLIERVVVEGEESCPEFNMPCLIDAETVKTETVLSLQNNRIFKSATSDGVISYVHCPKIPEESCYFFVESGTTKKNTIYITNSTKIMNGNIQNLQKGQNIRAKGKIECPNLSDILLADEKRTKGGYSVTFTECKFFADEIEVQL
jgi:hypothetical protein